MLLTRTNQYSFYSGRHNYLINLGDKNSNNKVIITFSTVGIYTFDDLRIVCQPMQNINKYVDALQEDVLKEISLSPNKIEGRIDLTEPKILLISIPYSKGWKIMVNGKERELKQANTMFMAVELESGSHEIKLLYTTPYIKLGLTITIGSCFVFLLLVVFIQNKSNNCINQMDNKYKHD